ncbi:MAG: V-type ATP synthase subunit E [Schaedlerella sp.]|nr:V-type ATP synthase subunit E [Schaedlerella sp.]
MSGLDKIKSQILNEANRSAELKTARANAKAEKIIADAKAEAEAEVLKISEKSEAQLKAYAERIQSSCDMQRKKAILQAKQDVIASVIEKAYERVLALDTEEYFDMLGKILAVNVQGREGIICFSEKDLRRMPKGFKEKINKAAAAKGGTLTIAEEAAAADGGFVLVYGGVEENCTIRAIFNAKKEELTDKVNGLIFA